MPNPAPNSATPPSWMKPVLLAAAAYNLVWGAVCILAPIAMLRWLGVPLPESQALWPDFWACIGMIVGVYGIGYAIAAYNPARHWPIVLVALLGKIFGPIGFFQAVYLGKLPLSMGWTIITNDLIWWVPFTLILIYAWRSNTQPPGEGTPPLPVNDALARAKTFTGTTPGPTLAQFSAGKSLLVVFLRHSGCTFCREALADLAKRRAEIERGGEGHPGSTLVIVHMSTVERGTQMLNDFALTGVVHVSDPGCELYRAFDLRRGTFSDLLGPRNWVRGFKAGLLEGHLVGKLDGDGFRLGGVFVLENGRVTRAVRHATAADRPDYAGLACSADGACAMPA